MSEVLIGTSGYDYPEWKGVFYPVELKRTEFLNFYSTKFNALEINNTFYNMPTNQRLFNFYERSEGKIQFSVKANKLLTHEIPTNWQTVAKDFKDAVGVLQEKNCLCSLLFQFPQSFHYTPENRIYLYKLIQEFNGFPVVVEFRHKEWIKKSVFEGLQKTNTSFAYCDMPQLKYLPKIDIKEINQNGLLKCDEQQFYLRLHGRNSLGWYVDDNSENGRSRYDYLYSEEEINEFVPVIEVAKRRFHKVVVFFNNHPNGSGVLNALSLKNRMNNQ